MNTKSLFKKALAFCLVGTFGILGAACGSESNDCPSGEIRSGGECVPVQNDGGMDDGGGDTCNEFDSCMAESCSDFDRMSQPLEWSNCAESNCQSAYEGCPDVNGLSCEGFNSCLGQCSDGDQTCRQQCRDNAGQIGDARFQALIACQQSNSCGNADSPRKCLLQNCSEELTTCLPNQIGNATCSEIFTCQALGVGQCDSAGTKEAQITQSELLACANENECSTVACIIQNCTESANSCGITGEASCKEVNVCQQSAGSNQEFVNCLYQLSPQQGAADYDSLQTCLSNNCSETQFGSTERITCTAENCPDARNACGLSGTDQTCSDMWDCANGQISECDNAEDTTSFLFSNYVYEGTAEDQVDFLEFVSCVNSECPNRETSCIETNCGEQATACGIGSSN